jgi:hypothetical protein
MKGDFSLMKRLGVVKEFWLFLKVRKMWWLAPVIILLLLLGGFVFIAENSTVAPFIYAVF